MTTIHSNFNERKAINAVLYIVTKLKRKDFHKIFKILYFADREHLSEFGRPISGDIYIAMDDGPVPSNIYDIFKAVRGDGYFKDVEGKFSTIFKVADWDLIVPLEEPNLKTLSKTDMFHLDKALELYGDMTWEEVKDKSHDYAWEKTARNTPISFENMVREAGNDDEYIDYLKEKSELNQLCR